MDDKDFVGTITAAEARKSIFEDVLGFKQEDLAGLTIGFNRGRVITYKLKQQIDIDRLYRVEHFSIERSRGQDVSSISFKIRGVRDPSKRDEQPQLQEIHARPAQAQLIDDGSRQVRIIGCEYRLTEVVSCFLMA